MRQVDEMPTSGQFVAVWQTNNEVCSDVFRWCGDVLISSMLEYDLTSEDIAKFISEEKENQCKCFIAE